MPANPLHHIKKRILKIFASSKNRRLAIIVIIMILICIIAGLTFINSLSFEPEISAYKDALAQIDAITANGKIANIEDSVLTDDGLPERLFDIIYSGRSAGDIDTKKAYQLIAVICERAETNAADFLAQLFKERDAFTGAVLYEFMAKNMTEETARSFTDSVTALYAMDEQMELLWHAAGVDAVPRFNLIADDFTLPVYIWDEAAQSELKKIDPFRILYMNIAGYLNEYNKNDSVHLTGCDGSILYFRGAQAGQIGSARYAKFDYESSGPEIFDLIFGGKHTPAENNDDFKGSYTVSAAINENGGLDVLYDVAPGILVPISWSPGFKDAAIASRLIFFNAAPKIKTPEPSPDSFDLSLYETGFNQDNGAVTDAYNIDLICNYSQYDDSSGAVKNSIILPRLTDNTAAANELNTRIVSDFLSYYGAYLPYLVSGDIEHSPVQIIADYSYTSGNETEMIIVMTHCYDFILRESITRYECYYFKEAGKTEATLADYLLSCQKNSSETYFLIGSDTASVAAQLNSEQVRLANSGNSTRELTGYTIQPEDIKGVFRNNNTGTYRIVAEAGVTQYVFELAAGTEYGWDYYYMYDNTKSLRGDNLDAYILIREQNKFVVGCDGMPPCLIWLSDDKIAFTEKLSDKSCRIAAAELSKEQITNEYILTSDDIAGHSGIDTAEYYPVEFNFLNISASPDGSALTGRYFLTFEKRDPEYGEISEDGIAESDQITRETCEGYVRADLTTGEMTFTDAQMTEIPTEFKVITIIPKEISENSFGPDSETTETDHAEVMLTIPVTWVTDNGFLFTDSTRTEEKGYVNNKRFEGCYQIIRTGADFIWDSDVNIRAAEQYGEDYENSFGYGKGTVRTSANGYTVAEYPGVYYIRVSEEFALFIRMYVYEDDPAAYNDILRGVIDSIVFTYIK